MEGPPRSGPPTDEERETAALDLKAAAAEKFKAKDYDGATQLYVQALGNSHNPDLRMKCFSNLAQCYIFLQIPQEALQAAEEALKLDPTFVKSIFRKATALNMAGKHDEALLWFRNVIQVDPQNKRAQAEMARLVEVIRKEGQTSEKVPTLLEKVARRENMQENVARLMSLILEYSSSHKPVLESSFPRDLVEVALSNESLPLRVHCTSSLLTLAKEALVRDRFDSEQMERQCAAFFPVLELILSYLKTNLPLVFTEPMEDQQLLILKRLSSLSLYIFATRGFEEQQEEIMKTLALTFPEPNWSEKTCPAPVQDLITHLCSEVSQFGLELGFYIDLLRKHMMGHLLFNPVVGDPKLKNHFIRTLLALTGKTQMDEELHQRHTESSTNFINKITNAIIAVSTKTVLKLKGFTALSLFIQSDYKSGVAVACREDMLTVLVASAENEDLPESRKAAECLALCVGNPQIRQALLEVEQHVMFVWLLKDEDYDVRVHGALALAKFGAIHQEAKMICLRDHQVVNALMPILEEHLGDVESRQLPDYLNIALECLGYLCLHFQTKEYLVDDEENDEAILEYVLPYAASPMRSVRYAVLQILLHMSLAKEDKLKTFDQKEEAIRDLKEVTERGMPHQQTKEHKDLAAMAGTSDQISEVRERLLELDVIQAFQDIMQQFNRENDQLKSRNQPVKKLDDKVTRDMAQVMMLFAEIPHHRGTIASQGGVSLMLDTYNSSDEKGKVFSGAGLARLCISLNPVSIPSNQISSIIVTLGWLVTNSPHELFIYEALLALTNISSMGQAIREEMWKKRIWWIIRDAFENENDQIDQAIMECQSNFMQCDSVMDSFDKGGQSLNMFVRIWLLFVRSDLTGKQFGATCCLHIATYSEVACKEIARLGGVPMLEVVRQRGDPKSQVRAKHALDNLAEAGFRIDNLGEHNIDTKMMEDLMNPEMFREEDSDEEKEEAEEELQDKKEVKVVPTELEEVS